MHYIDTSVLVTALTNEPRAETARRWLFAHQDSAFISDWVLTEFAGALALKLRIGALTEDARRTARNSMSTLAAGSLALLSVTRADFAQAALLCDSGVTLRSGDALHAAVAREHGLTMVSRDKAMVTGARELGLDAIDVDGTL